MAKSPRLPNGRFPKGHSGNPSGRNGVWERTPLERAIIVKTRTEVGIRAIQLITMSHEEAKELAKRTDLPLWERAVLAVAINAINSGDSNRLEKLMTLAFGPQRTPIEITGRDGMPLIPRDPELTGQKLTDSIRLAKALLAAKAAGKLALPTTEKTVSG